MEEEEEASPSVKSNMASGENMSAVVVTVPRHCGIFMAKKGQFFERRHKKVPAHRKEPVLCAGKGPLLVQVRKDRAGGDAAVSEADRVGVGAKHMGGRHFAGGIKSV